MICPRRIAVLDWAGGRLVHAVAGQRTLYQELGTRFPNLAGRSPRQLLQAVRQECGIDQVYVADLDRLQPAVGAGSIAASATAYRVGTGSNTAVAGSNSDAPSSDQGLSDWLVELLDEGWTVWSDRGRDIAWTAPGKKVEALATHPRWRPIWGTESFASPGELFAALRSQSQPSRWTVSLDLSGAEPLGWFGHGAAVGEEPDVEERPASAPQKEGEAWATWNRVSLEAIVGELWSCGVRRVVVLNLSNVGTLSHTSAPQLRRLRRAFPDLELIAGGGVRDWDRVRHVGRCGADHVLVGTWLWEQLATTVFSPLYPPIQTC
jgi:uncharacterized protein related to proFAR isomerase